jgi:predicted nucleic acid-binding protein
MSVNSMFFIDTNIFIYAHDRTDLVKSELARELIKDLIFSHEGRISTQVVQEFLNVTLKKSAIPLKVADVRNILREIMFPMLSHFPDATFYLRALDLFERYQLGFYDALIIQAAIDQECKVIYSEDLQNGMKFGSVKVINPFIKT